MDGESAKKPTRIFGLSKNVIAMGVVSFFNDLSSDMVYPFIPIFLTSVLGATAGFVGLVEGIADATASVLKIFSGYASDRLRVRKRLAVFGYSLSAIVKPALALAMAPWHVLAVRFVDRVGKGVRDAPRDTLISVFAEKSGMGRAFGFHRGADTLGAAVGPLVGFLLLPFLHNNLRLLFLLSFVASFFAVLTLAFFVREVENPVRAVKFPRFQLRGLGVPFFIFLAASTIFALGRASEAFLLLRAQSLGVALMLFPLLYAVFNITSAFLSTPAGILSDKIGHRNTFMIGMILFSATYLLFARVNSLSFLWVLFALYGLYHALTEGVGRAIVADLVGEEWRATAYGVYNACTGFALLPASLIFGILWDRFGPAVPFRYGAVLGIIAFLIFAVLRLRNGGFRKRVLV